MKLHPWLGRTGRVLIVIVGLLALGLPATSAAPSAARALKMIWGPVSLPNGGSAFPTYHRLGVQVFQLDLKWEQAAPTRPLHPTDPNDPAYQWPTEVTQAVREAATFHIQLCLLVQLSPGWANGNRPGAWAPTDPSDYADFLIAASRRYPSVHDWMIWGEPNRAGNFYPMPNHSRAGPRRYAQLLAAAYHALKSVSRRNVVIGGDTWSFGNVEPADFLRWMRLPNGKPPPLDYYGHNPFSMRFPSHLMKPYFPGGRDIDDIGTLESQLRHTYHHTVKLWLSEFTVSSNHNGAFNFHVSRKAQARWLKAAYKLVDSQPYVAGLGWFDLLDEPPSAHSLTNGLLTWRMTPKPAFYAYEHAR